MHPQRLNAIKYSWRLRRVDTKWILNVVRDSHCFIHQRLIPVWTRFMTTINDTLHMVERAGMNVMQSVEQMLRRQSWLTWKYWQGVYLSKLKKTTNYAAGYLPILVPVAIFTPFFSTNIPTYGDMGHDTVWSGVSLPTQQRNTLGSPFPLPSHIT